MRSVIGASDNRNHAGTLSRQTTRFQPLASSTARMVAAFVRSNISERIAALQRSAYNNWDINTTSLRSSTWAATSCSFFAPLYWASRSGHSIGSVARICWYIAMFASYWATSALRVSSGLIGVSDIYKRLSVYGEKVIPISDETTTITTGTAKATFRMPFAMTLTAVRASLTTASTSGLPTFDINEGGSTILSTKITIDANELTSTTAATQPVISDSALADDASMTIDIDVAGTGAKGAKIYLIGRRT